MGYRGCAGPRGLISSPAHLGTSVATLDKFQSAHVRKESTKTQQNLNSIFKIVQHIFTLHVWKKSPQNAYSQRGPGAPTGNSPARNPLRWWDTAGPLPEALDSLQPSRSTDPRRASPHTLFKFST